MLESERQRALHGKMRRFRLPTFQNFGISGLPGDGKSSEPAHHPIFKSGGKVVGELTSQSRCDAIDADDDDRFADASSVYSASNYSDQEPCFRSPERILFTDNMNISRVERLSTDDLDLRPCNNTDSEDIEVVLTSSHYSVGTIQEVESRTLSCEGESSIRTQNSMDVKALGDQITSILEEEAEVEPSTFILRSPCSKEETSGEESRHEVNEDTEASPFGLCFESGPYEVSANRSHGESIMIEAHESSRGSHSSTSVHGKVVEPNNKEKALKKLLAPPDENDEPGLLIRVMGGLQLFGKSIHYLSVSLGATMLVVLASLLRSAKEFTKASTALIFRGREAQEEPPQSQEKNVSIQTVRNTCQLESRNAVTGTSTSRATIDYHGSSTLTGINSCVDEHENFPVRPGIEIPPPPYSEDPQIFWKPTGTECPSSAKTVASGDERLSSRLTGSMETSSGSSVSIGTNETDIGASETFNDVRKLTPYRSETRELKRPLAPTSTPGLSTKNPSREFGSFTTKVEYEQSDLVLSPLKITKFNGAEGKDGGRGLTTAHSILQNDGKKVGSTVETKTSLKKRPQLAAGLRHRGTRPNVHLGSSRTIDELKAVKDSVLRALNMNKNYHEVRFECRRPAHKTLTFLADLLVKEYDCTVAVKKSGGLKIRFEKDFEGRKLRVRATFYATSQFSCTVAVCRSREDDLTVSWKECDAFVKSFQSSLQSICDFQRNLSRMKG